MAKAGTIGWIDLTVDDADGVGEFYEAVVGWKREPAAMDGYNDYSMVPPDASDAITGVCHARGTNAQMPPAWMIYITVENLDNSIAACEKRGGEILVGPKGLAGGRFCVIKDPAGAVCALWQE